VTDPECCWPTSRPATSIPSARSRSCIPRRAQQSRDHHPDGHPRSRDGAVRQDHRPLQGRLVERIERGHRRAPAARAGGAH
jgi:hypothetical protein